MQCINIVRITDSINNIYIYQHIEIYNCNKLQLFFSYKTNKLKFLETI